MAEDKFNPYEQRQAARKERLEDLAEMRAILKGAGFKWSPNRGAWVRFLNDAGRAAAQYVISKLSGQEQAEVIR